MTMPAALPPPSVSNRCAGAGDELRNTRRAEFRPLTSAGTIRSPGSRALYDPAAMIEIEAIAAVRGGA
ncbi:hypothetical protein GJV26_14100 [Massilia dura]|uniref:Uncharacterized protein n=1 Tax=Pseudoduganella dura TaxID=321982 RepID=A0A6I3XD49_9BURK|nr:hypothetical protein [Pseudoduganella dura]MUI13586.1 hypothetical protein [Pseudoduganella dura]GGX73892.1 hypothetical protein GCM10007386_00950 [Pseudoduganella dura]